MNILSERLLRALVVRMDIHIHMLLTSISCLFFITLPQSLSQPPSVFNYSACKEWPYNCGTLSGIFYPFWGENRPPHCGGGEAFRLSCHDDITTILIASHNLMVKNIHDTTRTMRVVPTDLDPNVCSLQSKNIYDDIHAKATHFLYPNPSLYSNNICEGFEVIYDVSENCTKCLGSEGECWKDEIDGHDVVPCYYCPDGSHSLDCSPLKRSTSSILFSWTSLVYVISQPCLVLGALFLCHLIWCNNWRWRSISLLFPSLLQLTGQK